MNAFYRDLIRSCGCASCRATTRTQPLVYRRSCGCASCEAGRFTPVSRPEAKLLAPTEVRMTWKLRRRLQEEAARSGDQVEAGGFVYGRCEPHILGTTTRLEILDFSAGSRLFARRTAGSAEFSRSALQEALRSPDIVGDWHSHCSRGSFEPSATDLGGWGARADQVSWRTSRSPGYIGLIVCADEGQQWITQAMQLRAWFVPPLRSDGSLLMREPHPIPIREVE